MPALGAELAELIISEYSKRRKENSALLRILKKIEDGAANYLDAHKYAVEAGKMLSEIIGEKITIDVLPDGRLSFDDALKAIGDPLKVNFNDVSSMAVDIQRALNDASGINLEPVAPQMNAARIRGMSRLASSKSFDRIIETLKTAVETFSEHTVDDTIKANADNHYSAGLRPKIIRRGTPGCCKWCSSLIGTYDYPLADDNIFRRHKNCRCTTEYDPGDGRRQNVWNQREWHDADERQARNQPSSAPGIHIEGDVRQAAVTAAQNSGEMKPPKDYDDCPGYAPLDLTDTQRKVFADLRKKSDETGFEYGVIIKDGVPGEYFTSNSRDSVTIPLSGLDGQDVTVYHSHTNTSPLSAADYIYSAHPSISEIGVIAADERVYIVKYVVQPKYSENEIGNISDKIGSALRSELKGSPEFFAWSPQEREWVFFYEKSLRTAKKMDCDVSAGFLNDE